MDKEKHIEGFKESNEINRDENKLWKVISRDEARKKEKQWRFGKE